MELEVDPEKMGEDSDETLNTLNLELMCQKFVLQITRSYSQSPWYF